MDETAETEKRCKTCGRWARAKRARAEGATYRDLAKEVGVHCMLCERHPSARRFARLAALSGGIMSDRWIAMEVSPP